MIKRVTGIGFLDVMKDIVPFFLCTALTMIMTYFLTYGISNVYLLLLVRVLLSATIYFCIMKLLRVKILDECINFAKKNLAKYGK